MRAATRSGCSTVTVRPRSSVKVYAWAAELEAEEGAAELEGETGAPQAVREDSSSAPVREKNRICFMR